MAEIAPTPTTPASGGTVWTWTTVTEADTAGPLVPSGEQGAIGVVAASGTFGGASVALEGSLDGVNWYPVQNLSGDDIAITAAGASEFTSSMAYIRPTATGGTGQTLTLQVGLRG